MNLRGINMQRVAFVLFFVGILSAGLISLLYTQYRLRGQEKFLTEDNPLQHQSEQASGQSIQLTETMNGKAKWIIMLDKVSYNRDQSVAKLDGVKGQLFDDQQKVLFRFVAPTGIYDKEKGAITLNKGVTMYSPATKVTIKAPHMAWSSHEDSVEATGGVEMSKQDFGISRAQKAVFAMDFSKIQFSGRATSIIGGHSNAGD